MGDRVGDVCKAVAKEFGMWVETVAAAAVRGEDGRHGGGVFLGKGCIDPANLVMGELACLADRVDCYNVDMVELGAGVTVSQDAVLCTASHDICSPGHELVTAPISICDRAWVAAGAFVGMGVTVGTGAVVGARAAVFRDVEPWTVVGGTRQSLLKSV